MTILTVRPGQDGNSKTISIQGGGSSFWDSLNDSPVDDNTYINLTAGQQYPNGFFRVLPAVGSIDPSINAATQRIKAIRLRIRTRMNGTANGQSATVKLAMRRVRDGQYDLFEDIKTSALSTVELVGTWRAKPPASLGGEWTGFELERAEWEVRFYKCGLGTNLRVSEMYLDIDVRDKGSIASVTVTGTTSSTQPTITWVYTNNTDGDPQVGYQVKVFSAAQYTASGFSPDTSTATWNSGELVGNAGTTQVGTSLTNGVTYRAYVRSAQDFNNRKWWSDWKLSNSFTMTLVTLPSPTLLSLTSDQTVPFLRNRLSVQANWNLLSAQDADLEGTTSPTGTWAALGPVTIARSTTFAANGAASLRLTATGSGNIAANTNGANLGYKVKAGQSYTALASFRSAATPRQCFVGMGWFDRTGTAIGTYAFGTGVTSTTSGWTQASYTFTAPATAAYGMLVVQVNSAVNTEVHYVDKMHVGTNVVIGTSGTGGSGGTTTPVIAGRYSSGRWSGSSKNISAVGVPAGALLVVTGASGTSASGAAHTVTSSPSLTWTTRQENTLANSGEAYIATAYAASAGDYTVTIAASGTGAGDEYSTVYAITGHDEQSFGGASNKASSSSSAAPIVSLTTTRENSLVICVNGDFNEANGNNRVYRAPGSAVIEDEYHDFGGSVTYAWHSTRASIGAGNEGISSPSGQAYGICAIEIRGVTGSTSVATGWSPGGYVGTASTVVERAIMSSGARNFAHPNIWSGGDYYKTNNGWFVFGDVSLADYDTDQRLFGEGSIRWGINNTGSSISIGYPVNPIDDPAPFYALTGLPGRTYTFSLWAIASMSFSTALTLQAIDQYGTPVGSAVVNSGLTVGTSWGQLSATITVPSNAVYIRPTLANSASVTEVTVWLDAAQWAPGGTADSPVGVGKGRGLTWEGVRYAGQGDFEFSDGWSALIETVYDNEVPPGSVVLYRSYNYVPETTTVPALSSGPTVYVPALIDPPGAGKWVVIDPTDSTKATIIRVTEISEEVHEEASTYYPVRPSTDLLSQRAVVVTDFIGGTDGNFTALCDSEAEWLYLERLFTSPKTYWMIFPEFGGRFVRFMNRTWTRTSQRTGVGIDSVWRRTCAVSFIEADRPVL